MLERMRESSKSGLTMIIFAVIMVVFAISFGAPMDGCQAKSGPQYVATVAGHDIQTDELGIVYNRWGGSRDRDADESTTLSERAKALKALVLIHLLADEGQKLGLQVSDDELKDYILSATRNAEFQQLYGRSGKINKTYYENYINNQLRVSIPQYQNYKRRELMARKYMELVEMQIAATPAELKDMDQVRHTRYSLEYIRLSAQALKDNLTLTDAEVAQFSQEHADKIKARYEETKQTKYSEQAKYKLRRLFLTVPADSDEAKRKELRERFDAALARVKDKGEDLALVAAEVGDDYFAKNTQGLMEWTPKEYLPQEISEHIDALKPGELKEASTPGAYILYKLEEQQEAKVTPLEDVQSEIARELMIKDKINDTLKEMVGRLEAQAKTAPSLEEALQQIKAEVAPAPTDGSSPEPKKTPWDAIQVATTPPFNLEGMSGGPMAMFGGRPWDMIPGIGKNTELAVDVTRMTPEQPLGKQVYTVGEDRVIVRLKARYEPGQDLPKPEEQLPPGQDGEPKKDQKDEQAEQKQKQEARQRDALRIEAELRSARADAMIQGWQSLFLVPSDELGPWLEGLYQSALKDKRLRFSQRDKVALFLSTKADPVLPDLKGVKPSDAKPADIKSDIQIVPAPKP